QVHCRERGHAGTALGQPAGHGASVRRPVRPSGAPQVVVGFAIVAAWELVTAVGVVAFRKPMYKALSLVANMLGLAVLFMLLYAQFLFAAQIIVYAEIG